MLTEWLGLAISLLLLYTAVAMYRGTHYEGRMYEIGSFFQSEGIAAAYVAGVLPF